MFINSLLDWKMIRHNEKQWILIEKLKEIGVIKYGKFLLKSGVESSYYCDFRTLISYPRILESVYDLIPENVFEGVDLVCGVYFGGIPLANLISFKRNIPQIFIRDSEKTHGTKKQIEGIYKEGQTVLLIEDVITTGGSVIEKMKILERNGLNIIVLTILNRNENLISHISYNGETETDKKTYTYRLHSVLPLDSVLPLSSVVGGVIDNQISKIYKCAFRKKSNIILSVDLQHSNDIIALIEETKDNIVGIKIHSDMIEDFPILKDYIKNHLSSENFLVIEDCKVADISFISIQKIKSFLSYADYITYHCLLGKDLPLSLKKEYPQLGLLGVVEMSVKDSLITNTYIESTEEQLNIMDGCVIQKRGIQKFGKKLPPTFSPGISMGQGSDTYNQTYKNPLTDRDEIGEFWIIGRSIYQSLTPKEDSQKYRDIGWHHFLHR